MSFGGDSPFDIFVPSGERSFESVPTFLSQIGTEIQKATIEMEQRI